MHTWSEEADPDPITIAYLVLAGISAVAGTVGVALIYRDQRSRPRRFSTSVTRSKILKVRAGLERLVGQTMVFRRFLETYEIELSAPMILGGNPVQMNQEARFVYQQIVTDLLNIIKDLHSSSLELAVRLEAIEVSEEVRVDMERSVQKIGELILSATYDDFFGTLGEEASALQAALHEISTGLGRQ